MILNKRLLNRETRPHLGGFTMRQLLKATLIATVSVALTMPSAALGAQQVWLMAGQSNMIGWGTAAADLPVELQQPQTNVKIFTGSSWNSLAPGFGNTFGPEIGFGHDMAAAQPDVDVLLVKATFGLGNLYNNWRSPNTGRGAAGEHYTNFMALANAALASRPDAQIAGMIWMQGEGDGYDTLTMATSYTDNLRLFVESVRNDFHLPNMPFVLGQISSSNAWAYGGLIQQAQAAVAGSVHDCYMVTTSDLPLSDNMHYTSQGQVVLGSRFAHEAMQAIGVPEPSVFALLATALAGLLAYPWWKYKRVFNDSDEACNGALAP